MGKSISNSSTTKNASKELPAKGRVQNASCPYPLLSLSTLSCGRRLAFSVPLWLVCGQQSVPAGLAYTRSRNHGLYTECTTKTGDGQVVNILELGWRGVSLLSLIIRRLMIQLAGGAKPA